MLVVGLQSWGMAIAPRTSGSGIVFLRSSLQPGDRQRGARGRYRAGPRRQRCGIEDEWCAGKSRITELTRATVASRTAAINITSMTYLGRTYRTLLPSLFLSRHGRTRPRSRRKATARQAMAKVALRDRIERAPNRASISLGMP